MSKAIESLCPVCGERDPYPRWVCLYRAIGEAEQGKPCSYSLDAFDRMKERFAARAEMEPSDAR